MPGKTPSREAVREYLKQHNLEVVLDRIVNDAVSKLVENPFTYIAGELDEHSKMLARQPLKRRTSLGDVTVIAPGTAADGTRVQLAEGADGEGQKFSGEELKRQFKTKEVELNPELHDMLKAFFDKMDGNKDGSVTKEEAIAFWGKNFAKVNATSMFNEVDENGDNSVTWLEFLAFWKNVVGSGYDPDDIKEEVEMMLDGGSWVDFDDGRTT